MTLTAPRTFYAPGDALATAIPQSVVYNSKPELCVRSKADWGLEDRAVEQDDGFEFGIGGMA